MAWWWLSFADPKRLQGTQFLGVAILQAEDSIAAWMLSTLSGINPGGEVRIYKFPDDYEPQGSICNRLLSKEDLQEAGLV